MRKATLYAIWISVGILLVGSYLYSKSPVIGSTQDLDVKVVDAKGLKKSLAEYKDKIVVVNFWATWCAPCREEFPDLVEFSKKFRNQGIVVATVSIDDESSLDAVKKFLREQKAYLPSFLVNVSDMDAFINTIDPKWSGVVPSTFVYDQKGNLTKRMVGGSKLKDFEQAVQPLIKSKS